MVKKIFRFVVWISILTVATVSGITLAYILKIYNELPELKKVELNTSSLIYDSQGVLLDEIHSEEHRKLVELEDIDQDIINAIIAIEDKNFYSHNGIDSNAVIRAAYQNFINKEISSGASTLTMQLIKNLYLTNKKSWERKITEAFLARELERHLSKEEILELYLNTVYWGNNTYGIETATETYFGKTAKDVDVHEAAMLAALIQNPSRYNPYGGNYSALKARQKSVLKALFPDQPDLVERYSKEPLLLTGKTTWQKSKAPFVSEAAIKEVLKTLNITRENLEVDGYQIYTTVNKTVQDKAIQAVEKHSDWKGEAQIALVSIDPSNNKILATVGSKDFDVSPLNRSLESNRQPGSAIKPFVYYTAFEFGISSNTEIIDEEYCIPMKWGSDYCPTNYGNSFAGPDTIYNHLIKSRNIPAVKVGQMVGINNVISNMQDLGFTTKLDAVPSFPLGANDVIPVEMANAYAAFANGGYIAPPTIIEKVLDRNGNILIDNSTRNQTKVLNTSAVTELDFVLQGVVTSGTGTRANIDGLQEAGKTGTTDKQADTWFIGYTDDISTAVWIGNDDYNKKLPSGATGGGWAAPIWRDFTYYFYN